MSRFIKKEDPPYERVNTAFSAGGGINKHGFDYSMKTVAMLLGDIPISYYIGFNMNVVKDVVNAMGGVDYDVDTEVNMNGRVYHPGMQHLDGQGVLDYSRQRKGTSDIARVDRQQRILLAIFNQMKQTNQIVNIPKIYSAVSSNMQTNLSMTQISALALFANKIGMEKHRAAYPGRRFPQHRQGQLLGHPPERKAKTGQGSLRASRSRSIPKKTWPISRSSLKKTGSASCPS